MEKTGNRYQFKKLVAVVAACVMLVGTATAAYTGDIGGIQRTLQLWIHGDQTEATITFDGNGSYSMDYTDGDGTAQHQGGGGVAFGENGAERPLTEEELLEALSDPEVRYEDDGTVWVYWYGQKIDITDKFENGFCYVKLVNGDEILYMTVEYQNGYMTSPAKYQSASAFN
ncbi:MAG: hypothetical protein RR288_00405 [Oscillibacter sp.]